MKERKIIFPKGFFTQTRPHTIKQNNEDLTPFQWSENVLNGKSKVKIVSLKDKSRLVKN